MNSRRNLMTRSSCVLCLVGALLLPTSGSADEGFDRESLKIKDSVLLRSGAQIRGKVLSESEDAGRKMIVFQMDDGGTMKLDLAKFVTRVVKADELALEYNQHIETMEDTAEAHWNVCQWCLDQKSGKQRFKSQIRFHRERIMELDPNDTMVKKLLGYEHVKEEGRWVPSKEYWASLGYEKKGTRWAPFMQRTASSQVADRRDVLGVRKAAFKRWKNSIKKNNMSRNELLNELYQICDAAAISIILEDAEKQKNPQLNELYTEAFGRIPTGNAIKGLVYFYMQDNSDRALTLLGQEHYSPEQVASVLKVFLGDTSNVRVRRAAFAIGELNAQNMILPLVDSLVTVHQVAAAKQAGRMQLNQGGGGGAGGLNVGGNEAAKKLPFRNVESLDALRKITQQDLGYDTKSWLDWYVKNHTHHDIKLRGPRIR